MSIDIYKRSQHQALVSLQETVKETKIREDEILELLIELDMTRCLST